MMQTSPNAAANLRRILRDAAREGERAAFDEADELMGGTDCPDGCVVEPDGTCPHGYVSAGLSAGLI